MERAVELDPQNFFVLQQIALSYNILRRYAEAAAALDKAISLAPGDDQLRVQRATLDFEWRGDTKPLHDALDRIINRSPNAATAFKNERFLLATWEHDPAAAAETLKMTTAGVTYDLEVVSLPQSWCEGMVARMRGDATAAKAAFTQARNDTEKLMRDQPDDVAALAALGMIDAALGRKKEAVREARRALQLLPVSKDAVDGVAVMETASVIYGWVGKTDDAIDELTATAKLPGYLNYGQLKHDPLWDPLRRDPRFEKIVASLAPK
jgi:tetratricopeptide (TPR) repeat protein